MFSENGINISYTSAHNARDPFMALGINTCPTGMAGEFSQFGKGWCNPTSATELLGTAHSGSLIWPGLGMVISLDAQSILSYAVTAPFTHNSWLADMKQRSAALPRCWGRPTARQMGVGRHTQVHVEATRQRLDGVVSIDADFRWDNDTAKM